MVDWWGNLVVELVMIDYYLVFFFCVGEFVLIVWFLWVDNVVFYCGF